MAGQVASTFARTKMLKKIEERNVSISNAKRRWVFLKEKTCQTNTKNLGRILGSNVSRGLDPSEPSKMLAIEELPPDMTISGAAPPSSITPRQRPRIINITQVNIFGSSLYIIQNVVKRTISVKIAYFVVHKF